MPMRSVTRLSERPSLYERDYYLWALEQASALRERRFEALDLEHLLEEVEGLAKTERRELRSRLTRVLAHLLKWQLQAARRSVSWQNTLAVQRTQIADLLNDSPTLRKELPEIVERAYRLAVPQAGKEMRAPREQWKQLFPARCPWTAGQILDEDFYPEDQKRVAAPNRS